MKIVFIGNDKSILTGRNGDARERMRLIAKHLDKLTIVIFTLQQDDLRPTKEKKLEIYPTNSRSRWTFIFNALQVLSKHNDFDLISTQDPFISGLVGVLAKHLWHKKLNIQVNNDFFDTPFFRLENFQNLIFYCLGKMLMPFADSIRVMSKRMDKKGKYFVATIATDLNRFFQQPRVEIYKQVVTIARLAKQKNLPLLFEAAKTFPNLKFVIIGEGEERKNLERTAPKNVLLPGQKDHQEVREILLRSDMFLLTSNYEGWGISVAEALAAGLPIVMTDVGCAGEIVVDRKFGGFVTPVGDPKALIKAVKTLYVNRDLSRKLVLTGQKNLFRHYSQNKIINSFLAGLKNTQ